MIEIAHVVFAEICVICQICINACHYWKSPKIELRAFMKDCQLDRVAAHQPFRRSFFGLEKQTTSWYLWYKCCEKRLRETVSLESI